MLIVSLKLVSDALAVTFLPWSQSCSSYSKCIRWLMARLVPNPAGQQIWKLNRHAYAEMTLCGCIRALRMEQPTVLSYMHPEAQRPIEYVPGILPVITVQAHDLPSPRLILRLFLRLHMLRLGMCSSQYRALPCRTPPLKPSSQ